MQGFGEAAPIERYDETAESAKAFLDDAGDLVGDDPFALEDIGGRLAGHPGEQAAKAALDAALHDLCGKLAGVPVWKLLGLRREGPPTRWRSEEHTSELQSRRDLVCRLLLEKKKKSRLKQF